MEGGAIDVVAEPTIISAPAIVQTRKQIAICGTTPTRMYAPIPDPKWQIWTIGPGGKDAHRWDRLYEVHHVWPENFAEYLNDLSQVKRPQQVWTMKPAPYLIEAWRKKHGDTDETRKVTGSWEANEVVPRDMLIDKYVRHLWFSSSISYALALAIEEEATDVGLYGIDLESGEEYISQFVGCAHLLDLAKWKGINIHLPPGCGLDRDLRPYPERYETNFALTLEKKAKWLEDAVRGLEANMDEVRTNLLRCEGAIIALRNIGAAADLIQQNEKQHFELTKQLNSIAANLNTLRGEGSATAFYRRMFVWGVQDP